METITEQKAISALAQLRAKLGQKAKQEPKFRFYTLYHHLSREDVLHEAWKLVKKNGGAAGYDGVTIQAIEESDNGVGGFLTGIQEALKSKTYHPSPIKRVYIPKSDGKLRPLGIPTVKDRVVQTALLLIIEPIFEQDFLDCSYGFRPARSAHQAIDAIKEAISKGSLEVYDADLKGYFDSIPHDKLMKAVETRIVDQQVLKLIRKWLQAPIWEPGKPMNRNDKGTPQGGIISPLLANIYLHWFDKLFHGSKGPGSWAKAKLVRYADDFVIMARYMTDRVVSWVEDQLEGRFSLEINRDKTKVVDLKNSKNLLNFLGFSLRWTPIKHFEWKKFCLVTPAKDSLKKAKLSVRRRLSPRMGFRPITDVVKDLNLFLNGWGQYFYKGNPSKAFNALNSYVDDRVHHFLKRRSQKHYKKKDANGSWYKEFRRLGVVQLKRKRFV